MVVCSDGQQLQSRNHPFTVSGTSQVQSIFCTLCTPVRAAVYEVRFPYAVKYAASESIL
jgi:hypothetical protein